MQALGMYSVSQVIDLLLHEGTFALLHRHPMVLQLLEHILEVLKVFFLSGPVIRMSSMKHSTCGRSCSMV